MLGDVPGVKRGLALGEGKYLKKPFVQHVDTSSRYADEPEADDVHPFDNIEP